MLLRPQGFDRVPSTGGAGGDEAGDEREQHGDADEHEGACPRQAHDVGHLVGLKHVGIHWEAHDHHDQDGKDARDQALDEGLGVEDALDVALGRADGAQDADLLLALQDADVGDDADHDGAHHQRDAHEGNEHQADHVHDVRDGAHDDAHVVRVANHVVVLAGCAGPLVVGVNGSKHVLLGRKVLGVDGDGDGVVRVRVAQGREVVVVGESARVGVIGHERGQVLGAHVEADGALEGARVNREGALQVGQARAHLVGNLGHDLPHGCLELRGDGGAHLLGKLGEEVLQVGGQLVLHVVSGNLLHAVRELRSRDGGNLGQDGLGLVRCQVLLELLADDSVEVGIARVGGGAVLAPPGHKALGELAGQTHDLPDLVGGEGRVDVAVRIAEDGREVRRGRTGDQGAHVKRGRDCRGVNAHARHVDAREVDAAELGRVEGKGAPELCLVDGEEAAQVNALLGLVLELVEGLAGEDVRVGVRKLLPDDVGAGRAGHELLGEAMGVGDARAEGVGVGGLVGPHDAHDLEVKAVCHLLGHELRVVGHVGPAAGLRVGAVGLAGAQHLEGLVEGVLVGKGDVVIGHVHVTGGSHGGLHHAGQLAGVKHADAVERVVAHAAVAVEDQDGLVGGRCPTARHHVVLLGEKVLVVDHLVEDVRLRHLAQLGMPVLVIGEVDAALADLFVRQRVEHALGDHGGTVVHAHDLALDDRRNHQVDDLLDGDFRLVEHLGNDDHRVVARFADAECQVSCRAAHGGQHEPVAARACVDVDGAGDDCALVLGRLVAERRRALRKRQVVVDGLGDVDVGDGVFLGLEELGDTGGGRSRVVAADGHEQLDVVLGEEIEVEILLEILVGRFETTHRQVRAAAVENIVGQQEIDVSRFRVLVEQARITAVQADHAKAFLQKSFGNTAHYGVHSGSGTAAGQNCN